MSIDSWDEANDAYWDICVKNKVEPVHLGERDFYKNGENNSPRKEALDFFKKHHGGK